MIGNDVVDLALAQKESNWKRIGFFNKLFTLQEQQLIKSSENHEIMIWNLWSRKEAAYKIYNRQTGIRTYNPSQFECFDVDLEIGKVVFENQIFYTKTSITTDCIYTESVLNTTNFDKIKSILRPQNVQKEKGIPYYFDEFNLKKPVSITHHGRFEKIISMM